jgi:hypothetical protein
MDVPDSTWFNGTRRAGSFDEDEGKAKRMEKKNKKRDDEEKRLLHFFFLQWKGAAVGMKGRARRSWARC